MRPPLNLLAILGLALLLAPTAAAQITSAQVGAFGTQTRVGDSDYTPLMKESKTWTVAEADLGAAGVVTDNCILLMYGHAVALGPVTKDIRLNNCLGKGPGTLISDSDQIEKKNTYTSRGTVQSQVTGAGSPTQFSIWWMDIDGGGKYNKGDAVYMVSCATCVAAPTGLVPSTGTGVWTLRLTPVGSFAAGTLAMVGDKDLVDYSSMVKANVRWIIGEREDKGWYLVDMSTAIPCCFTLYTTAGNMKTPDPAALILAGSPLPLNAIRLGLAMTFSLQPSIIVTGAELANPDGAEAGKPLPVIVTMTNNGATAGYGVLVTKLDKQIVDVRMSPLLSPGEFTKTIVTVAQVPHAGQQELEVNEVFMPVNVKGTTGTTTTSGSSGADVADLQAQIATMQSRLATLEASGVEPTVAKGSPSVAPLAAFGCLAAVALILRRRAA